MDFTYNTEDCHGPSGFAMTTRATCFTQYSLKKQSQLAGLRPEIRSTKLEILNLVERVLFEKTKPIAGLWPET